MRPLGPGDVVAGKYRVERVLGEGGMGIVLGAQHVTLGERVALKVLKPEALTDGEARARFLREARAAARMKGDHIARVLDVESPDEGTPYIAMEYLEGSDLSQLVERHGVLPVDVAVDYVLQACEALAEAHALGIVHRDVKPSNLFLTRAVDGSPLVKVLDFGISKATSALDFDITATQSVLGSPAYMAPEQMRSARRVDGRTDIWAIGTILHELLTGRAPFESSAMPELCAMILQDPAPPLRASRPDIPAGLETVVARCLEKQPDARFPSIHELAEALAPFGGQGAREAAARISRMGRPMVPISEPRISIGSTPRLAASAATVHTPEKAPSSRRLFLVAFVTSGIVAVAGVLLVFVALDRRAGKVVPPVAAAESAPAIPSAAPTETATTNDPIAAPPPTTSAVPTTTTSAVKPATTIIPVRSVAKPAASTHPPAASAPAPAVTAPSIASSRYD